MAEQASQLQALNRPGSRGGYRENGDADAGAPGEAGEVAVLLTREDMENEEQEIRELERKKRGLEERVEGMGRDLGGLMR